MYAEEERFCTVCNDLASYFCRMCSSHYCSEHLCLHLSVPWEGNSWTKRNTATEFSFGENLVQVEEEERDEIQRPDISFESDKQYRDDINNKSGSALTEKSNARSILSYSDQQLEEALGFYNAQARRIRRELERRSIPSGSLLEGSRFDSNNPKPRVREPKLSKSNLRKIELLSNAMRANNLTREQIEAVMKSSDTRPR